MSTTATTRAAVDDPDEETLGIATLAWCADGPDALMQALLGGASDASAVVEDLWIIHDHGRMPSKDSRVLTRLDEAFAHGVTSWGAEPTDAGFRSFHRSLARWSDRMRGLPRDDPDGLRRLLTHNGTQWIITAKHPLWPTQMNDLSRRRDWATPLCLWGQGDPTCLTACASPVALVGSRGCDDYGRTTATTIAQTLASDGHVVISGGAMGTDAAAHWGSIRARSDDATQPSPGRTVAIFAGGLDHAGPQCNTSLFRRIIDAHGALISELAPGTIPVARRFLLRNRLIAALSSSVVVAQARIRSGALNTAGWGNELGRPVYAVPGRIDSPRNGGCHQLIRNGQAILLHSTRELDELVRDVHGTHDVHSTSNASDRHNGPDMRGECHDPTTPSHLATSKTGPASEDAGTTVPPERRLNDHAMLVLEAIAGCAHDHVPASVDVIRHHLRRNSGTTLDTGRLLSVIGGLEAMGMVTFHSGVVTASTGSRSDRRDPESRRRERRERH